MECINRLATHLVLSLEQYRSKNYPVTSEKENLRSEQLEQKMIQIRTRDGSTEY